MDEALEKAIRRGVELGLFQCKVYDDDIQIFTTIIMDAVKAEVDGMSEKKNAAK